MVRAGQQEYPHSPHQSLSSHHTELSAAASALRQGLRPAAQSVSVVVGNPATTSNTVSKGSEGASAPHEDHQRGSNGLVAEKDLYYVQMPGMSARASHGGGSGILTPNARATKRVHEADGENDIDAPRKHGKRLTTKEEVSLFEICNRHADSFGKRSDICNWWKTVAGEFTRAHGRPYSWHSVRRKVEMATKQRIKFLEEQRHRQRGLSGANPIEHLINPQWCAVLDTWLPTWQRWEESETRRIAKRDEMVRKRSHIKPRPESCLGHLGAASSISPVVGVDTEQVFQDEGTHSTRDTAPVTNHISAASTAPATSFKAPSASTSTTIELPPGFENMFSNHKPAGQSTPPAPLPTSSPPTAPESSANNPMFSAVLETLGKLNKHLDAASSNGGPDPRSSPVISAIVQAASEADAQSRSPAHGIPQPIASIDIARLKEELRQEMRVEMRRELERDRGALEEKLDSVQRTQEMILEMLRQEPA